MYLLLLLLEGVKEAATKLMPANYSMPLSL